MYKENLKWNELYEEAGNTIIDIGNPNVELENSYFTDGKRKLFW